ncbi:hypothetical protein C8A05DRAFT_17750, partial [Staphylotrichum tortipilum]
GGEVWGGLPCWGWVVRDGWNFDPADPTATPEQRASWENTTGFLAQLTVRSARDGSSGLPGFPLYALWAMRDATEEDADKTSQTAARLAALWVRYAGEELWRLSVAGQTFPERTAIPGGRYSADREWRGFSEDRWAVWKAGLEAALGSYGEGDDLIQAAVERMGELERKG